MSELSSLVDSSLSNTLQALSRALLALRPESDSPLDPRLADLITTLPRLTELDTDVDGVCPICLVSFHAHLAEEEMASVMESPAHAPQDLGVTRLQNTCKHMFCRKDIVTWIRQARNSCPTCRRPLLPPDQSSTSTSTDQQFPNASDGSSSPQRIYSSDDLRDVVSRSNIASSITLEDNNANVPDPVSNGNIQASESAQDNPETAAARLVNDVIRDVLDRLSVSPPGSGLTSTDLHTLLESVLPTLIPPTSQSESSDILDFESEHEYPARNEFNGMYS